MEPQPARLVGPSRPRTLSVFVICIVLSFAVIVGFPVLHNSLADGVIRGSLAVVLAGLLTTYSYGRYLRLKRSGCRSKLISVPGDQAYKLQRSAGRTQNVSFIQAKVFALAVVAPAELRQRLIERYDPSPRALRHRLTIITHIQQSLLKGPRRRHAVPAKEHNPSDEREGGVDRQGEQPA